MQKDLGGIFDDLAKRMVGSITDEDINKLNAYQRTVSAAIATDKAQLLKGQPTMNVGVLVQVLDVLREQEDDGRRGCYSEVARRARITCARADSVDIRRYSWSKLQVLPQMVPLSPVLIPFHRCVGSVLICFESV